MELEVSGKSEGTDGSSDTWVSVDSIREMYEKGNAATFWSSGKLINNLHFRLNISVR